MTKDIVGRLRFTLLRGEDWPPSLHAACDRYEAAVNDEAPIETLKDAKRAFGVEMLALDKWRRPTFYAAPVESLSPPDGVGLTRYTLLPEDDTRPWAPKPNGAWVRYEDAAAALAALTIANDTVAGLAIKLSDARAALAAEKARGDGLAKALRAVREELPFHLEFRQRKDMTKAIDMVLAALSVQPEETKT